MNRTHISMEPQKGSYNHFPTRTKTVKGQLASHESNHLHKKAPICLSLLEQIPYQLPLITCFYMLFISLLLKGCKTITHAFNYKVPLL